MSYEGWAKGWLQGVAEARVALERAEEMLQARRERALCVSNPLGDAGPHGKGGGNPAERNVVGLIQAEEEYAAIYEWTCKALEEFDHLYKVNRPGLHGTLADGLDADTFWMIADNQLWNRSGGNGPAPFSPSSPSTPIYPFSPVRGK